MGWYGLLEVVTLDKVVEVALQLVAVWQFCSVWVMTVGELVLMVLVMVWTEGTQVVMTVGHWDSVVMTFCTVLVSGTVMMAVSVLVAW